MGGWQEHRESGNGGRKEGKKQARNIEYFRFEELLGCSCVAPPTSCQKSGDKAQEGNPGWRWKLEVTGLLVGVETMVTHSALEISSSTRDMSQGGTLGNTISLRTPGKTG